jgi:hypothetical protein
MRGESIMLWITAVVRRDDVENAVKSVQAGHHASTHCLIARALCRALGLPLGKVFAGYDLVEVYDWKAYAYVEGVPTNKMLRAMQRFDASGAMTPWLFRLKLEPVPQLDLVRCSGLH